MTQEEKNIKLIQKEIEKIDNKKNKIMFFVMDSKNAPLGSLSYIYETAYQLKEMGYNVHMLHDEKEFVGVESWLGEKYSKLPHDNIKSEFAISPSDIMFIPELFTNIMAHTKALPCKRVVILQNLGYMTDFIQPGVTWDDLKMRECVTTSEFLKSRVQTYFPNVQTHVVRPSLPEYFTKDRQTPRQLIINIVAKNKKDVDSIIKPFYWKHPEYKWVSLREVKNVPREDFAKYLNEGVATVWCDTDTSFGYSALEAMSANNIVIGKIPENNVEWLYDKDGNIRDNGIWFYNSSDAPDAIANFIEAFISDEVPSKIYSEMENTVKTYTTDQQIKDIEMVYVKGIFEEHKKTLELYLNTVNNFQNKNSK